jgi:hypothetical protein
MAVSFIGGGNRRTGRKPLTCRKSLILPIGFWGFVIIWHLLFVSFTHYNLRNSRTEMLYKCSFVNSQFCIDQMAVNHDSFWLTDLIKSDIWNSHQEAQYKMKKNRRKNSNSVWTNYIESSDPFAKTISFSEDLVKLSILLIILFMSRLFSVQK